MPPLPKNLPRAIEEASYYPHIRSSYEICLKTEAEVEECIIKANKKDRLDCQKDLMYIRILGYLLLHAPSQQAIHRVHVEIVSCEWGKRKLLYLGKMYHDHLIRAFRSNKGRMPEPQVHPSRHSFDSLAVNIASKLQEPPSNYQKAKTSAQTRDGFKCIIFGAFDANSILKHASIKERSRLYEMIPVLTECAHIFPLFTNASLSALSKVEYSSKFWSIISHFGYSHIVEELNGPNIHRLENILTLSSDLHGMFDGLLLFLTPTETRNRYKVEMTDDETSRMAREKYVTFALPDLERFPLPCADYLTIHASCIMLKGRSSSRRYTT